MRVHLRNVVAGAIEQGVVIGFHRSNTKSPTPQVDTESEAFVNTIVRAIWERLDHVIDFADDDEDGSGSPNQNRVRGFGPLGDVTDAVGANLTGD